MERSAEGRPKGSAERMGEASRIEAISGLERYALWLSGVQRLRNICHQLKNARYIGSDMLRIETQITRIEDDNRSYVSS